MKKFGLILLLLAFGLSSCKKDKNYPKDSILGTWRCFEQGSMYGYRQYNVDIDLHGSDSSIVRIFNFYNLGYDFEVIATISDTLITIFETNNLLYSFAGSGSIERDFSAIYWRYSYLGDTSPDFDVEALFRRP